MQLLQLVRGLVANMAFAYETDRYSLSLSLYMYMYMLSSFSETGALALAATEKLGAMCQRRVHTRCFLSFSWIYGYPVFAFIGPELIQNS